MRMGAGESVSVGVFGMGKVDEESPFIATWEIIDRDKNGFPILHFGGVFCGYDLIEYFN
jgi:hypothetical protein